MARMECHQLKRLCRDIRGVLGHPLIWSALAPGIALAGPAGESVVAGSAAISRPDANTTNIVQSSQSAIIDWRRFSVGAHEFVEFFQPQTSSVILNRVVGPDQSSILGHLSANGRVFLVNPHGVYFGPGAHVDVGGLVATTLDIDNDDFMAGNYEFVKLPDMEVRGEVINEGVIQARENGFVVLAGDYTKNTGVISARLGTVALGAGSRMTLDVNGTGLVSYVVDEATVTELAGVENSGALFADGGRVIMTAKVAEGLIGTAVNQQGLVQARSISTAGGRIVLGAAGGDIANGGTLDVSAAQGSGADGGEVSIHASGNIEQTGAIHADGEASGGSVRVVAEGDLKVREEARITATGPETGGLVEVSGHGALSLRGGIVIGKGGKLIIDPTDLIIANGTGAAASNIIFENFIEGQLQGGASVQVVASRSITINNLADNVLNGQNASGSGGALTLGIGTISSSFFTRGSGSGNGAITMVDANDSILLDNTFTASGGIATGDVSLGNVSATNLHVTAAGNITVANFSAQNSIGGLGTMSLSASGSITANTLSASATSSASITLRANTGAITVTGAVSVNAGSSAGSTATLRILSAGGDVTLNGPVSVSNRSGSGSGKAKLDIRNVGGNVTINNTVSIQAQGSGSTTSAVMSISAIGGNVALNGALNISASSGATSQSLARLDISNVGGSLTVAAPVTIQAGNGGTASATASFGIRNIANGVNLNGAFTVSASASSNLARAVGFVQNNLPGLVTISGNNVFTANGNGGGASLMVNAFSGGVVISGDNRFSHNAGAGQASARLFVGTGTGDVSITGNNSFTASGGNGQHQAGITVDGVKGNVVIGNPADVMTYTLTGATLIGSPMKAGISIMNVGASPSPSIVINGTHNITATGANNVQAGVFVQQDSIGASNLSVAIPGNINAAASTSNSGGKALATLGINGMNVGHVAITGNNVLTALSANPGGSARADLFIHSFQGGASITGNNTLTGKAGDQAGAGIGFGSSLGPVNNGNVSVTGNNTLLANAGFALGTNNSADASINVERLIGNVTIASNQTFTASSGTFAGAPQSAGAGIALDTISGNIIIGAVGDVFAYSAQGKGGGSSASPGVAAGIEVKNFTGSSITLRGSHNVNATSTGGGFMVGGFELDALGGGAVDANVNLNATISGSGFGRVGLLALAPGNVTIGGNLVSVANLSGAPGARFAGIQIGKALGSSSATGVVSIGGTQTHTLAGGAGEAGVKVFASGPVTLSGNQTYTVNSTGDAIAQVFGGNDITVSGALKVDALDSVGASSINRAKIDLRAGPAASHDITIDPAASLTASGEVAALINFNAGGNVKVSGALNAKAIGSGSGLLAASFAPPQHSNPRKGEAEITVDNVGGNVSFLGPVTALATNSGGDAEAEIEIRGTGGKVKVSGNRVFTATGTGQALAVLEIGGVGAGTGNRVDVSGSSTYTASGGGSARANLKIGSGAGASGRINGAVNVNGSYNYTARGGGNAQADMRIKNVTGNITVAGTYTGSAVNTGASSTARVGLKVATNVDSPLVTIGGNWSGTASGGAVTRARIKVDLSTPTPFADVLINANTTFKTKGNAANRRAGLRILDGRNISISGTHVATASGGGSPSFNFAGIQVGNGLGSNSATGSVNIAGTHTYTTNYSGGSAATAGLKVFAQGPVTLSGNQKYAIGTNGKAEVRVKTPTHITVNGAINADPITAGGDNVAVINLAAGTSGTTGDLLITSGGALTASADGAAGVYLGAGRDVTVNGPITVRTSGSGVTFASFGSGLQRGMALLQFQPVGRNLQVNAPLTVRSTHQRFNSARVNVFGVGGNANLIGGGQLTAVNTGARNQTAALTIGRFGSSIGGDVTLGGNWAMQANGPAGSDGSAQIRIDRVGGNVSVTGTGNLVATGTSGSGEASFTVSNVTGDVGMNANYIYTGIGNPSDATAGAKLNINNIGGNVAVAGTHLYTASAGGSNSASVEAGLFIFNVNTGAGSTVTVSGTQTINATGNSSVNSLSDGVFVDSAKDVSITANVSVNVSASDIVFGEKIGVFVNRARNVTVSGNNTISMTGVGGNNNVGIFLGTGSFTRNSGAVSLIGNNTVRDTPGSGSGNVALKIWGAGPVTVSGIQRYENVAGSGNATVEINTTGMGPSRITPTGGFDLDAGTGSGNVLFTVTTGGPVNSSGTAIPINATAPGGLVQVSIDDPVSLSLTTRTPQVSVAYPAQVMAGNTLGINNNGFLAPASFNIGASSGGSFGQVSIVTGGDGTLNNDIAASGLTFGAGGHVNVAGRSFMTTGLTNLSAGGNILFGGVNAVAGNIVMTAGGNVDDQVNAATLSADGLFLGAGGNITTGVSTFNVGGGLSGAQGDPVMLAALRGTTIPPFSADPNAAFIAPGQVDIGNLNLTFNGVDASHVLYQGAMIRQLGAVNQPNPDLVVQFAPFDPTATIGVEQNAPGVRSGLDLSANGLFNKFSGTTVVIGNADQRGMITIGQNGPVGFGAGASQNVVFMTAGGFDNIDGLRTGNLQTAFAVEPDNLGPVMTSGIVLVIDPFFSNTPVVSPGQVAGTLFDDTASGGAGAGTGTGTEPALGTDGGDGGSDTGDTGDTGTDQAPGGGGSDDEEDGGDSSDDGGNADDQGSDHDETPADQEAANESGECF